MLPKTWFRCPSPKISGINISQAIFIEVFNQFTQLDIRNSTSTNLTVEVNMFQHTSQRKETSKNPDSDRTVSKRMFEKS
jgi:hypothetical protein